MSSLWVTLASACSQKRPPPGFLMESSLATWGCSAWRGTRAGLPGDPHLPLPMPVQPSMTEGMTGNYSSAHLPSFGIHKDHTSAPTTAFPLLLPFDKEKRCLGGNAPHCCSDSDRPGHVPRSVPAAVMHSDTGTDRTEPLAQQAAGLFRDCCNS